MRQKNTLHQGSVRYIVFREDDVWYGVCLEFNIVESGDTPEEALLLLFEATQGYLASAQKIKARPHILNQQPDKEYEKMWESLETSPVKKQTNVYASGRMDICNALARQTLVAA